jgi:hypothetical protein
MKSETLVLVGVGGHCRSVRSKNWLRLCCWHRSQGLKKFAGTIYLGDK